jgi:hypothetical protein
MRSVWICSHNDAIGNFAVLLAAMGVFGTGTGWPDVIVASIMGGLGLWGGWQIVSQAQGELRRERAAPLGLAAEQETGGRNPFDPTTYLLPQCRRISEPHRVDRILDPQGTAKSRARRFGAKPCLRAGSCSRCAEDG